MNMLVRPPTETELTAYKRRQKFHRDIAAKAAALAAPKVLAPIDFPSMIFPVMPDGSPLDAEPPKKKWWFSMVGLTQNSVTINQIRFAVADEFGLTGRDLMSPRRFGPLVLARQIAIYLCKEMLPEKSYPVIGRAFGGRDHTTIMHACRVAPGKIAKNPKLAARVQKIRADLEMVEQ